MAAATKYAIDNVPDHIELSKEKANALRQEAEKILSESVEALERFDVNGKQFCPDMWKIIKSRERVNVYKQIFSPRDDSIFVPANPSLPQLDPDKTGYSLSSSFISDRASLSMQMSKPMDHPLVVASGLAEGKMEDYLLGTITDGEFHKGVSPVYQEPGFDCIKTLALIDPPHALDPMHHLRLNWYLSSIPIFNNVAKPRDYIALEYTGFCFSSTGERIGYRLFHSLSDPDILQDFPGVIRGNYSFCWLLRQHDEQTVELYAPGFVDPKGKVFDTVTLQITAQILLTEPTLLECGRLKKLQYLMGQPQPRGRDRLHSSDRSTGRQPGNCSMCKKRVRTVNPFASILTCAICHQVVCNKCSVAKEIAVWTVGETPVGKMCRFCMPCLIYSKQVSAAEVARVTMDTSLVGAP